MQNKKIIYHLINEYLSGKIDAENFCSEFHKYYDLQINLEVLNETETKLFAEISIVASRYSNFEEDLKKYPQVFYTETELKNLLIDAKRILIDENNILQITKRSPKALIHKILNLKNINFWHFIYYGYAKNYIDDHFLINFASEYIIHFKETDSLAIDIASINENQPENAGIILSNKIFMKLLTFDERILFDKSWLNLIRNLSK